MNMRIMFNIVCVFLCLSILCFTCFAKPIERIFPRISYEKGLPGFYELPEYEAYLESTNRTAVNFVSYDMLDVLGVFHYFHFPYRSDGTEFLEYTYDFKKTDGSNALSLRISASGIYSFAGSPAQVTDGMQDMRRMEQNETDIIRHNGLLYEYNDGILSKIYWEYADLLFAFEFSDENEMDIDHPIIGRLLSKSGKDVKEGLNLLKANMYKNGFVNVPLIFWTVVTLVAVAVLAVFLILRSRRKKRNAAPCTVPADAESPNQPDQPLPPAPDTP